MPNRTPKRWLPFIAVLAGFLTGQAENLLPGDSGYEAGRGYFRMPWGSDATVVRQDDSDAAEGKMSAEFTLGPGESGAVCGPEIRLAAGEVYTLSFLAKAGAPAVSARIGLINTEWKHTEWFPLTITGEWRRYQVTFKTRREPYQLLFSAGNPGSEPLEIRLDACQLEKGGQAGEYTPAPGLYTGLFCENPTSGIFFRGEPVRLRVLAMDSRPGPSEPLSLQVDVTDYQGKTVREFKPEVRWDGRHFGADFALNEIPGYGLFTVRSRWRNAAGREVAADRTTYAVVREPLKRAPGIAPFCGMNGGLPPGAERIGVGWAELCTTWENLAPKEGEYSFRILNSARRYRKRGLCTKLSLIHQPSTPQWARDPADAAEAVKAGFAPGKNLLPAADKLDDFRKMWRQLAAEGRDCLDLIELGGEDDLIVGSDPFYRKKYAGQVLDGYVCGEVSTRLGKMTRAAVEGIRAGNPAVRIAVNRVSGEDCYQRNFNFTRGVLKELQGDFDWFSMDAYCRRLRHIDEKNTWIGLPERDMPEVFANARRLTAESGKHQPPFISEYGYAIDVALPPDHPLQREMAKRVSRSLMMARALGTPVFFWFSAQRQIEAGKYDYAMWRYGEPTMMVPAYAMAARAVENARGFKLAEHGENLRAAWFDQGDRAVVGFWNVVGDGKLKMEIPAGARLFDMMGNEQQIAADGVLPTSDLPQYLELEGPDSGARLRRGFDGIRDLGFPFRTTLALNTLDASGIGIANPTAYRGKAVLKYVLDRGAPRSADHEFTPESSWFVPLPSPLGWRQLSFTLSCAGNGEEKRNFGVELEKWPENGLLRNLSARKYIMPPDPHIRWRGPADLSVKLYGGYDADSLTLNVIVRDDRHFNRRRSKEIWNGDCLQLAVHPQVVIREDAQGDGYSPKDTEWMLALTEHGTELAVSHGALPGLQENRDYSVTRDDAAGTTQYRIRLPRKALGLAEPGKIFGFSMVVFDDDDGTGQSFCCQMSGGIIGAKNSAAFPLFVLMPQ